MMGKSLKLPAQITAQVCCWVLCLAGGDMLMPDRAELCPAATHVAPLGNF